MNEDLTKAYTEDDVYKALMQMHRTKAPGPDGMSPVFFQKYQKTIGRAVSAAVLKALNSSEFPQGINHTFITLVPKKKIPLKVTDYRPISLCNVIYKLVLKVIANILKIVLPHVISVLQSAFISGRLISDNVLISYELIHYLRNKRKGKKGFMSLKLDISKAYDRIEWGFIEVVMARMGFEPNWVQLVMLCIKSTSFSILINRGTNRKYCSNSRVKTG